MGSIMKNYLVLFQPKDEITVATMKVVHAFSANMTLRQAVTHFHRHWSADVIRQHGTGDYQVVESVSVAKRFCYDPTHFKV